MKEFVSCCSNCEYYYSDFGGSVCNAMHTPNANENMIFYCPDFESKDIEKQMQRSADLQKKVRVEETVNLCGSRWSSEAFQAIYSQVVAVAVINGSRNYMRRAGDREYRLEQVSEANEDTDLNAEVILDNIDRQLNHIRYELNLTPKYVLLCSKYRRLIDRYFYEHSFWRYVRDTESRQPLQAYFGLEPLTPAGLPDNFIQVVAPVGQ